MYKHADRQTAHTYIHVTLKWSPLCTAAIINQVTTSFVTSAGWLRGLKQSGGGTAHQLMRSNWGHLVSSCPRLVVGKLPEV